MIEDDAVSGGSAVLAVRAEPAFIVLEGGDASGKSTQVDGLAQRMRAAGRTVITTFEPGATKAGAKLREVLLKGDAQLDPRTEALLIAADRAEHVARVVRPALDEGIDVVTDRYIPSSLVYQGCVRGLGVEVVRRINGWATDWQEADVVVVIDLPDDVVEGRRDVTGDRLEREGAEFHANVRGAYRELAHELGYAVVDGVGSVAEVADRVWQAVCDRLGWAK